jgi:hypothetical protein
MCLPAALHNCYYDTRAFLRASLRDKPRHIEVVTRLRKSIINFYVSEVQWPLGTLHTLPSSACFYEVLYSCIAWPNGRELSFPGAERTAIIAPSDFMRMSTLIKKGSSSMLKALTLAHSSYMGSCVQLYDFVAQRVVGRACINGHKFTLVGSP